MAIDATTIGSGPSCTCRLAKAHSPDATMAAMLAIISIFMDASLKLGPA
ncbi:hypothetical protein [Sinorhizobium sp. BG8]|nr:hypothetical protein [Sinorhizobium sp. BG8]